MKLQQGLSLTEVLISLCLISSVSLGFLREQGQIRQALAQSLLSLEKNQLRSNKTERKAMLP